MNYLELLGRFFPHKITWEPEKYKDLDVSNQSKAINLSAVLKILETIVWGFSIWLISRKFPNAA